MDDVVEAVGVRKVGVERDGGADPRAGETDNVGVARGAVVAREVKRLLGPLGLLALVDVAGLGEGGAEHGGEADGAGVVAAEDKGMAGGLRGGEGRRALGGMGRTVGIFKRPTWGDVRESAGERARAYLRGLDGHRDRGTGTLRGAIWTSRLSGDERGRRRGRKGRTGLEIRILVLHRQVGSWGWHPECRSKRVYPCEIQQPPFSNSESRQSRQSRLFYLYLYMSILTLPAPIAPPPNP